MKHLVLASAAVLALAAGSASAGPVLAGHGKAVLPQVEPGKAIYTQMGTDTGIAIASETFSDDGFDAYDSYAADDFKLKKAASAKEVDAAGQYFNGTGPADSFDVTFYKNKKGLPGAVMKSYPGRAYTDTSGGLGSVSIKIPKTSLKKGVVYWLSVSANINFSSGAGQWGWESQEEVVGLPAAWENPGGGFGIGCTTWTTETSCIPDGQGDHMFVLK